MHPVIRISCYLVGAIALAAGQFCTLAVVSLLIAAYALHARLPGVFADTGALLYRLRWLFISLWILYAGFTPGTPVFPELAWSPSAAGVREGLLRSGVLIVLILAVQVLLAGTSREELVNAIAWLARPLRYLGMHSGRLALRMVLVMETVPAVRDMSLAPLPNPPAGRLARLSTRAAQLYAAALDAAARAPLTAVELREQSGPPCVQWLLPVLLAVGLMALRRVCA